jgi:hypothetical protein
MEYIKLKSLRNTQQNNYPKKFSSGLVYCVKFKFFVLGELGGLCYYRNPKKTGSPNFGTASFLIQHYL